MQDVYSDSSTDWDPSSDEEDDLEESGPKKPKVLHKHTHLYLYMYIVWQEIAVLSINLVVSGYWAIVEVNGLCIVHIWYWAYSSTS